MAMNPSIQSNLILLKTYPSQTLCLKKGGVLEFEWAIQKLLLWPFWNLYGIFSTLLIDLNVRKKWTFPEFVTWIQYYHMHMHTFLIQIDLNSRFVKKNILFDSRERIKKGTEQKRIQESKNLKQFWNERFIKKWNQINIKICLNLSLL